MVKFYQSHVEKNVTWKYEKFLVVHCVQLLHYETVGLKTFQSRWKRLFVGVRFKDELPTRSAFVTPTTAMLFSTLDFPFFRRQNSNVSNFRTSRPVHGAISNTSRKILFLVEFWWNWRLSGVSVFGPAASWPCSGLVTRQEHCTAMYCSKCWELHCTVHLRLFCSAVHWTLHRGPLAVQPWAIMDLSMTASRV